MEASNIWSILDVMVSDMAQMLKQGIGANSGPAVFADSFLFVFMGMVVFACFFLFFHLACWTLHASGRSILPRTKWALDLISTAENMHRMSSSNTQLFAVLFFSSHIPCQAFLFFFLPALPAFLSFESYYYTSKRNSTRKFPIVLRCVPAAEKPKKKQHQPKNHIDGSV